MKFSLLLSTFLILLLVFPNAIAVKVESSQALILKDLMRALDTSAKVLASWNSTSDCSKLLGVKCDNEGNVVEIILRSVQTYTSPIYFLPDDLPNATLAMAQLNGSIPERVGDLIHLQKLCISGNFYSGGIPLSVVNLTKLTLLDLSSNGLTGGIPSALGQLKSLKYLMLGFNFLSGVIPDLSNVSKLISFDFSSNSLSGEPFNPFKGLNSIIIFSLGVNDFSGVISDSLKSHKSLMMLDLHGNNFAGSIPKYIWDFSNLSYVDFSFNQFNSAFPSEVTKAKKLESLILASNLFSGIIPDEISETKLIILDLSRNKFEGNIPANIKNLGDDAQYIDFGSNNLNGTLPISLNELKSLVIFSAANNAITGEIPPEMGKLVGLNDLYLSNNKLNGTIPKEFGEYSKNIFILLLDNNLFDSTLADSKLSALSLFTLTLHNNRFYGSLPHSLPQSLQVLDFSNNSFSGRLPSSYSGLVNLRRMRMFSNNISGELLNFTGLTKLVELDLSYNMISGSLGSVFSSSLRKLNLRRNKLSGNVPDDFLQKLPNLITLDLSENQLQNIPSFRNSSKALRLAAFEYNKITKTSVKVAALPTMLRTFGNPICSSRNNKNSRHCKPLTLQSKTFPAFNTKCSKPIKCTANQLLKPGRKNLCVCTTPTNITLRYYAPLFPSFATAQADLVSFSLSKITGISKANIRVVVARQIILSPAAYNVKVMFFVPNDKPAFSYSDSQILRNSLWKSQNNYLDGNLGPYQIVQ